MTPSEFFLEQVERLGPEAKRLLERKLLLVKEHPYRFKRIQHERLVLFRIRLSDRRRELRVIYLPERPNVKLLCILDRGREYVELRRYLERAKDENNE